MRTEFVCAHCGESKVHESPVSTGYGVDKDGRKICFECCGKLDAEAMAKDGRATLYLTRVDHPNGARHWEVSNWPGTLKFRTGSAKIGRHNIAGTRTDVHFWDASGATWHGVQYGENTQICHCRRLKG